MSSKYLDTGARGQVPEATEGKRRKVTDES